MVILGVEAAAGVAGAAITCDDRLLAEIYYNNKKTHSQTILPMIKEVLEESGYSDKTGEIDGIAVTAGPGSFTGLRIGSATVKGLAYAWKKPILAVPTMDSMAVLGAGLTGLVCPIMDARRNQVYTGIYSYTAEPKYDFPQSVKLEDNIYMNCELQQTSMGIDELADKLNSIGEAVTFLGDAVLLHREFLKSSVSNAVSFMPAYANTGRAAAVAVLGKAYLEQGKQQDSFEHAPDYLKVSQAERVRNERSDSKN